MLDAFTAKDGFRSLDLLLKKTAQIGYRSIKPAKHPEIVSIRQFRADIIRGKAPSVRPGVGPNPVNKWEIMAKKTVRSFFLFYLGAKKNVSQSRHSRGTSFKTMVMKEEEKMKTVRKIFPFSKRAARKIKGRGKRYLKYMVNINNHFDFVRI